MVFAELRMTGVGNMSVEYAKIGKGDVCYCETFQESICEGTTMGGALFRHDHEERV